MEIKYDYIFKIVFIGHRKSGKTKFLERYVESKYPKGKIFNKGTLNSNLGYDFLIKHVDCQGKKVKLQLWDPVGIERFRDVYISFLKRASAIIIFYDSKNEESFGCLPYYLEWVYKAFENKYPPLTIIVGTKIDKKGIELISAKNLAMKHNVKFFQTSAKTGYMVEGVFNFLVKELIENSQFNFSEISGKNEITNTHKCFKNA